MNLVGKIFVGVIALMSIVCLTLSVVSYAPTIIGKKNP